MARAFVPDDYATPPLESDEQADALAAHFHEGLEAIRRALSEQIQLAGLCAEYFEHRDPSSFGGAITGMASCANALQIISATISGEPVLLPHPEESQNDG